STKLSLCFPSVRFHSTYTTSRCSEDRSGTPTKRHSASVRQSTSTATRSSLVPCCDPHSRSSSVLTLGSLPQLAGAGRTDLPCSVLADKRNGHTGFSVRRLVEMIGHFGSGTVAVDRHVGDVVDEPFTMLCHRIPLPGKNIGLDAVLGAAGVGTKVGVVLPLQRVVLADRGPAYLLVRGLVALAEDAEQPDCDHDEHNDCQRAEKRCHRRPIIRRFSLVVLGVPHQSLRSAADTRRARSRATIGSGAVASATPSRRLPSVSSGRSNSRTSLSATASASPTTRRSTSFAAVESAPA